jgi:putative transposase
MTTKYNPAIHKRKSIRLKRYDYSQAGLYFITMCVQNRELLFGKIENDVMILNDAGKMIQTEWEKLPQRFSNIELDKFVVMPNHFHGILEIVATTDTVPENDTGKQPAIGATTKNDIGQSQTGATTRVTGATTRVAPTGVKNEPDVKNDTFAINDTGQPATGAPQGL